LIWDRQASPKARSIGWFKDRKRAEQFMASLEKKVDMPQGKPAVTPPDPVKLAPIVQQLPVQLLEMNETTLASAAA